MARDSSLTIAMEVKGMQAFELACCQVYLGLAELKAAISAKGRAD